MINARLVAERRTALNMSMRALVQSAGLTTRMILQGAHSDGDTSITAGGFMTLAELSRLANALGVDPAELLTADDAVQTGPPTDDVAVLLAALIDEAQVSLTHKDDLADALGWPLERVEEAARRTAEQLPALGLTLYENPAAGLGVRARHRVLSPQEQQRLARSKTVRSNMRVDHAHVFRDVALGHHAKNLRRMKKTTELASIQALSKRGLIEHAAAGLQITATANYSLLLTDEPPAEATSGRPAGRRD